LVVIWISVWMGLTDSLPLPDNFVDNSNAVVKVNGIAYDAVCWFI